MTKLQASRFVRRLRAKGAHCSVEHPPGRKRGGFVVTIQSCPGVEMFAPAEFLNPWLLSEWLGLIPDDFWREGDNREDQKPAAGDVPPVPECADG